MHLIQIGQRILNLEQLCNAKYVPGDPDAEYKIDRGPQLLVYMPEDTDPTTLYGPDADALWAYLQTLAAVNLTPAAAEQKASA